MFSLLCQNLSAQELNKDILSQMGNYLNSMAKREASTGRISVDSARVTDKTVTIFTNENAVSIPFRAGNVEEIYNKFTALLPDDLKLRKLRIETAGQLIEELIPLYLRKKKSKALTFRTPDATPLVSYPDRPFSIRKGLEGRHIGMWQSHGKYYEAKLDRWEWQRARIFQTVEDLYTQSYVIPFLVPMLERAGAYVIMPRERDANPYEVIVDNDPIQASAPANADSFTTANIHAAHASQFSIQNGKESWSKGSENGFAYRNAVLLNHDNPFNDGSYLQCKANRQGRSSKVVWKPSVPRTGDYAVYVSYKTLPNSVRDAHYTIYHDGGQTRVNVNQQMGGGTWIYVGTFRFVKGINDQGRIELSNVSDNKDGVVTADALKIGGGMGNVGRYTDRMTANDDRFDTITATQAQTSTCPRFCEGARYWMQWAGVPDSIYDLSRGKNDYTDDYKNRGLWINWMAGGSAANPDDKGLNVPIDLSFALHSDAGTTLNDDIIGTLAIFDSEHYNGVFAGGASRQLNHQLADLVQSNIVNDIRRLYAPRWNRRQMWDKSYFEAWEPKVPALLIELLSHQNFADMRYGLDPRFRFTVSRAIYKGMLQFIASMRGEKAVVQPLPVHRMAILPLEDNGIELSWLPTSDTLEETAEAKRYIVYTRIGDGGWNNGIPVKKPYYRTRITPGQIYSFKVEAVNDGGRSFPSEILSAGFPLPTNRTPQRPALVVNGFDRISAPADFTAPGEAGKHLAGFLDDVEPGMPYINDISYIGKQKEFRRDLPWMDDDAAGFGDSYGDQEKNVIAGNSFDYTVLHGKSLLAAGRGFVSCSREAVEDSTVHLQDFGVVDLILGRQCQSKMGSGVCGGLQFKTFTPLLQQRLTCYLRQGGRLYASGSYIASDLWDNPMRVPDDMIDKEQRKRDQTFAEQVLKYKWRVGQAATGGDLRWTKAASASPDDRYAYVSRFNDSIYCVPSPDALEPADPAAQTAMRYGENNLSAAVLYQGKDYKTFVMGVPFEAIEGQSRRNALMKHILNLLQ